MDSVQHGDFVTIEAEGRAHPPDWAVKQRYLIDQMNAAAVTFVERYTRPDGTLIWNEAWLGMDGSDDGYESFMSFPLFYLVGGGEHVHALARRQWDAVTWQFTGYGQVRREFDAYYDWMHHGESSTYIFVDVQEAGADGVAPVPVNDKVLRVKLGPWAQVRLRLRVRMER